MRKTLAAVFLLILTGCSSDSYWRVGRTHTAAISFLIKYTVAQSASRKLGGQYDPELTSSGRSSEWKNLSQAYEKLLSYRYACRFDIADVRFAVTCAPSASSGLQNAYYVDETGAIRLAPGSVGPTSPQVRLLPEEERELALQ